MNADAANASTANVSAVNDGRLNVDVWICSLERAAALAPAFARVLSSQEQERADRFRFPHLRDSYILAHGATRTILSGHLGYPPSSLKFRYGPQGKPSLADFPAWHFNVSHSGALLLCAVTRAAELGIDVERMRPTTDYRAIATRFFGPVESAALAAVSPDVAMSAFFECWTRKEAFLKATGDGLSRGLHSFAVSFGAGNPCRLLSIDEPYDDPAAWSVLSFTPEPGYIGAVAIRVANATLRMHRFTADHPD